MTLRIPSHNTLTVPTEDDAEPPWYAEFDLGKAERKAQTGKRTGDELLNDIDPWTLPGSTADEVPVLSCRSTSALLGIAYSHHTGAAVDGETAAQGPQRGIASVPASDQRSAISGGMTAGPAASSDNATVVVRELDGDVTPTENFDQEKGDTVTRLATIDEDVLHQRVEAACNAARLLAAQEEMARYEMDDEERVAPGELSLEALERKFDQYEEDRLLGQCGTEHREALGNYGDVVVNTANATHGVPVLTAAAVEVEIPRRDSGIKFTLTCVDDGYREDEVLFDDDFLFEEEIMDPDYFRKKDKERGYGLSLAVEVM